MRALAIALLFAVLPTMELVEQAVHVIEHALHAEAPDHSAHHDEDLGDEHGCTGLVHLCASHQVQVLTWSTAPMRAIESFALVAATSPPPLLDKDPLEPPQRPPIG